MNEPIAFIATLGLTLSTIAGSTQPMQAQQPVAAANPAVTIGVDAGANRHPIDPRIYGVSFADAATLSDLDITLNRWGGNAMSRYNWIYSTANRAKDWFFENIRDSVPGNGSNGESADAFIGPTLAAGAQPIITIPLMGLLPKDRSVRCGYSVAKYGPQDDVDPWASDCGNGLTANARMRFVNSAADTSAVYTSAHQANWVQHLVAAWGAANAGGVRYYAYDNEPVLWSFDHWDVHPDGSTYDEIWTKWSEYGPAIKAKAPSALLLGPEEWGWDGYFDDGIDAENGNSADRDAKGGTYLSEWLLQQARAYEQAHGTRILDVFTLHFYPQSGEFSSSVSTSMQSRRNRSTRSLWDPTYVDESWIGGSSIDGGRVRLIPRMKQWVQADYPGTMIGLTEYNWGADWHINGGTAQADILGILGREGVDMAVRWDSPPTGSFTYGAFKMYRNYDGSHSRFGDTSVSVGGPNPDQVAVFAAVRSADSALTIMIVAKTLSGTTPATVNLANFTSWPAAAVQRWQLDSGNAITRLADVGLTGSAILLTLPPQSITLLIVPGATAPGAPTSFTAVATNPSTVALSWIPVAGATGYEVYRSFAGSAYSPLATVAVMTYDDANLASATTYLYKVRAVGADGAMAFSAVDAATTIVFSEDPLLAGTTSKAVHITELRTAVNAMRGAAALAPQTFTDPTLSGGMSIRAVHVTELRTALDQARAAIGLPTLTYTDPVLAGGVTAIKAAHVAELRDGVK